MLFRTYLNFKSSAKSVNHTWNVWKTELGLGPPPPPPTPSKKPRRGGGGGIEQFEGRTVESTIWSHSGHSYLKLWLENEIFCDLWLLSFNLYCYVRIFVCKLMNVNPPHQISLLLNIPSWSYGRKMSFLAKVQWPLTLGQICPKFNECIYTSCSTPGPGGHFIKRFVSVFPLTTVISYWNPCIWLAESKFVSEKHWQNAWWNAPQVWVKSTQGVSLKSC